MRLINVLISFVLVISATSLLAEEIRDFYAEPGLHPFKDPIQNQSESIDPFSGMLRIQATDLVIPGNGGMDIRVTRSYVNPQNEVGWYDGVTGIGWTMHFGRIVVPSAHADKVCSQQIYNVHTGDNPSIEHQDGSRELLVLTTDGSVDLVTKSNWKARCLPGGIGFQVFSPTGTVYTMDAVATTGQEKSWFVTNVSDVHGNRIAVSYVEKNGLLYVNQVKGFTPAGIEDGRRIDYHYADDVSCNRLTSISTNDITIGYTLVPAPGYLANSCKYQLADVSYPEQMSWHYDYLGIETDGSAGSNSLLSTSNPYGGRTDYTYQYIYFDPSSSFKTTSVHTKVTSGSGVATGTWSYTFQPYSRLLTDPDTGLSSYADVTIVNEPYGKSEYVHQGYATSGLQTYWTVGLLLSKRSYDIANNTLEFVAYQWSKRVISQENYYHGRGDLTGGTQLDTETHSPLLMRESVWRNNSTHETIYSEYDGYGNPGTKEETTIIVGEPNKVTHFTYMNNPARWIIGKVQTETIDTIGTITRTFDASTADLLTENRYGVTTTYTYYPTGDIETVKNANNQVTTYSDYYRGIPRHELHPEGRVVSRTVNNAGTIATYVNGRGYTSGYSYDALNRLTGISSPINNPVSIAWTPYTGAYAKRDVTRGALVQTVRYDGFGRPLEKRYTDSIKGNVVTIIYTYDALGRVLFESYPNSSVGTSYQYDSLGRRTKITNADGTSRQTQYGTGGIVVTEIDERQKQSSYLYRAYGHPDNSPVLIVANTPASVCTHSYYNLLNQITRIHQGGLSGDGFCNGYSRYYTYNARYQLDTEQNPELQTIQYGRDLLGNMTSRQVGTSGVTTYLYDGLQRHKVTNYSDSTPDVSFDYDGENNLITINNGVSVVSLSYDANNNLESKSLLIDGKSYAVGFQYDGNDNQRVMTYPSGRTINYSPDAFGRPTQAIPYITQVTYHPSGQIASMVYANGVTTDMPLQDRLWLSRIHSHGTNDLIDLNYGYDEAGNVTSIGNAIDSLQNRTMTYDDANRLETAHGSWGDITYVLDHNGNISQVNTNGVVNNFAYMNQQLTSYGAVGDVKQVAHDIYGNVEYITKELGTYIEERHFMYDESGTLGRVSKRVDVNGQFTVTSEQYSYDGTGDRVKKIGGGAITYFLNKSTGFLLAENTGEPLYGKEYFYLGTQLIASAQTNQPPIANAGTDQSAFSNTTVSLSGSASSDPDGSIQSYTWAQTAGLPVNLSNATSVNPTFTAPVVSEPQVLTFSLTVTDNEGESSVDTVNVTVSYPTNTPPIANAGVDRVVLGNQPVVLDGSASSDADGTIAGYYWQQIAGQPVTLSSATTATTSFTAPHVTSTTQLIFNLTVTDNLGATASDTVTVTVNPGDITPPNIIASYTTRKAKGLTYYDVTLAANEPVNYNYAVRGPGLIITPLPPLQGSPIVAFTVQRTGTGDIDLYYSATDLSGNSFASNMLLK